MLQDRFFHQKTDVLYPIKKPLSASSTPTAKEQSEAIGGKFTRIAQGLPDYAVANFSPCLTEHKGEKHIVWRTQPEPFVFRWDQKYFYNNERPTEVFLGQLESDSKIVNAHSIRPGRHRMSYEDPRLFVASDGGLYCQWISSTYASQYAREGERRRFFDDPKVWASPIEDGYATRAVHPPQGGNRVKGQQEKNWCYFTHNGITKLLYSTIPLIVIEEEGQTRQIPSRHLRHVTGQHATFNSTAPIPFGNEHLVFYHWKHMDNMEDGRAYLKYHTSAYILDEQMTKIKYMVKKPLWSGSLEDRVVWWTTSQGQKLSTQPACVLPFGGILEGGELVMPMGVNDAWMGIFRCKLENLLAHMETA